MPMMSFENVEYHGTKNQFHIMQALVCGHDWGHYPPGLMHAKGQAQTTFGRIFPKPVDIGLTIADYNALGAEMLDTLGAAGDSDVDAGVAFLGQFIDHDLTLDASSELARLEANPNFVPNLRSPRLDLDSVYGTGPESQPYLYGKAGYAISNFHFATHMEFGEAIDFQRAPNGRAMMGDPRNDENKIVARLHLEDYMLRHNRELDAITGDAAPTKADYEAAKERVIAYYHDQVVHNFLEKLVIPEVFDPMLANYEAGRFPPGCKNLDWETAPDMPVEFSAAAFRFGHAMIRDSYQMRRDHDAVPLFQMGAFAPSQKGAVDLSLFFGPDAQPARRINSRIVSELVNLPPQIVAAPSDDNPANLAARNMIRGHMTYGLPSGEALAEYLGLPGLEVTEFDSLAYPGTAKGTPLWLYVLREAEANGGKLGHLGGTIVAGTLFTLLLRTQGRGHQLLAETEAEKVTETA